jgi:hypothetical protein
MRLETSMDEYNNAGNYDHRLIIDQKVTLWITNAEEKESAKGLPQLRVECDVVEAVNNPDWKWNDKIFHSVTFIPKGQPGHGIAVHFLKTLGFKPDENGVIEFTTDDLINKQFKAFAYAEKGSDGRKYQRINNVEAVEKNDALPTESPADQADDEVAF